MYRKKILLPLLAILILSLASCNTDNNLWNDSLENESTKESQNAKEIDVLDSSAGESTRDIDSENSENENSKSKNSNSENNGRENNGSENNGNEYHYNENKDNENSGNQSSNNELYDVIKSSYVNENIKISYPQITGLSDKDKLIKINDLVKEEALKVLDYYNNPEEKVNLDIQYNLTWKGVNLLSIQYYGVGYTEGAAYPNNIFYTTNVDMNNVSKVKLADYIDINEELINKVKDGTYVPWDAGLESASELIKEDIKNYDLADTFKNADTISEENTSYSFSYFTEDSLGISIGVAHALGDHAEFEIKYQDLKDNIKRLTIRSQEFF